jgi:hypothetical protein
LTPFTPPARVLIRIIPKPLLGDRFVLFGQKLA